MDVGVVNLQKDLQDITRVSERLILAKNKLSACDQTRDERTAALTALRKVVRELSQRGKSPHADNSIETVTSCRFCGLADPSTLQYVAAPGSSFFVKLPLHSAHLQIEKDLLDLEAVMFDLKNRINDMTLSLTTRGPLSENVGPSLLEAVRGRKAQ